jgi:hypothetical protein
MNPPTSFTQRNKSTFLELPVPDDIDNLEGKDREPLSDINKLPSSHWIHPAISTVLKGAKTIKTQ